MPKRAYANRYAQAVFEIAKENRTLEEWQSDLEKIAGLASDESVVAVLQNPKLPFNEKKRLLTLALRDLSPLAMNLAQMLVATGHLHLTGKICEEYQRLADAERGIERAEVTTAVPLTDIDKRLLEERLAALIGKKIVVKPRVDPEVLGGFVARINGKLLDGSTRSKLEALKKELAGVSR